MPVSRKPRKAAAKKVAKKRAKREKVGNRSAESGQYVTEEFAQQHPAETVAVTKEVEPGERDDVDPEC
jgi:hypothetical protein